MFNSYEQIKEKIENGKEEITEIHLLGNIVIVELTKGRLFNSRFF
jgi:hypothetical protein